MSGSQEASTLNSPPKKRVKRSQSTGSPRSPSYNDSLHQEDESHEEPDLPLPPVRDEIPDSEDDEEPFILGSEVDLETALPLLNTGRAAVAKYETLESAPQPNTSTDSAADRLEQRKWVRAKSSIYVDAFNLALKTVLEDESHLFDETEKNIFQHWFDLEYETQYLYVRLFLRKTAAWHRVNKLRYFSDISDVPKAVAMLQQPRQRALVGTPGDTATDDEQAQFQFAETSETAISSLDEASSLLLLDELKDLARDAKVRGKNKTELLQALRRTSQKQTGLAWGSLQRMDTEELKSLAEAADKPESTSNRDDHFTKKILGITGDCIRLTEGPLKLFERVHLVFYRSSEWTEKSLKTIILAKISRWHFPDYLVCRSFSMFPSRSLLLEFESALRLQFDVDNLLEFNPGPKNQAMNKVQTIMEDVYPRWEELVKEEQIREDSIYETGEGAYLRRFSPAWVYTRIIHKGLLPLGRNKEHKREHETIVQLLDQRLFHTARRGDWYQRKALLEEHYMWALEPSEGRSEDAQKKHWRRIALRTCETALQDRHCHLIYHYDLQKRVRKLEKALKIPVREQHDFGHSILAKPAERTVHGIRIEKALPAAASREGTPIRGGKTIWIDEREGGECSVESMCLSWYRNQGWKGYHSEGGIVRTLVSRPSIALKFMTLINDSSRISSSTSCSSTFPMSSKRHIRSVP